MKFRVSWFAVGLVACFACASLPACDLLGSSKVAQGQRYQADDQRYDPYFDNVHQQQVAAAAWPDDKKAARRPIVALLALTPAATDETIVTATRERAKKLEGGAKLDVATAHVTPGGGGSDGPLFAAVEETVRLELERAHKLKARSEKLEELAKHGEELRKSADKDYSNRGADKADEKKTEKHRETRRELAGSVDVLRSLARDATRHADGAQDFLEDLGDALEAKAATPRERGRARNVSKPLPPPPAKEPPKEEKKTEEKAEKPKPAKPAPAVAKPKPAADKPAPAEKPAPADKPDKPAPAEKPKPAPPPDEFNP